MTHPSEVLTHVETDKRLDPAVHALVGLVQKVFPSRGVADLLHGVWLGHPVHPLLTDVPLGAWTSAALLDLLTDADDAADALVAAGIAAAVPTAATGLVDFSATNPRQQRVGLVHALCNSAGLAAYVASLVARRGGRRGLGKVLGLAGLGSVLMGGYAGGHLSYRQAQGVNHAEDVSSTVPSGWQRVAGLDELPNEDLTARDVGGVPVLLLRRGDDVLAIADKCSHMSGPLSQGQLTYDRGTPCVQCPWHASVFRLSDGSVVHGPATAPQPRFDTRVVAGQVEVRFSG